MRNRPGQPPVRVLLNQRHIFWFVSTMDAYQDELEKIYFGKIARELEEASDWYTRMRSAMDYLEHLKKTTITTSEDRDSLLSTLENIFGLLVQDDDFTNIFNLIRSSDIGEEYEYIGMCISYLLSFIAGISSLLMKQVSHEEARKYLRKIFRFCYLAVGKHRISAKLCILKRLNWTFQNFSLEKAKQLNMLDEMLEDVSKMMKACEKNKPRDFGLLRLFKGDILKEMGKSKETLTEYEKAQDFFRKLIFEHLDKRGKKWKNGSLCDTLYEISKDYEGALGSLFRFIQSKGELSKAANVYESYLKRIDLVRHRFLVRLEDDSRNPLWKAKQYLMDEWGNNQRLDLARCYFQMKNYFKALEHFSYIIEDNASKIEERVPYIKSHGHDLSPQIFFAYSRDCDTFDMLDMVITCQKMLMKTGSKMQKRDIYLTPSMDITWQKDLKLDYAQANHSYHSPGYLEATLMLCMKTYKTQIHKVNLNEFYNRKLEKMIRQIRVHPDPKKCPFDGEDKILAFSLKVMEELKTQSNRTHLLTFCNQVFSSYLHVYKYPDEALDILMETLDFKTRDFDWNLKMSDCLVKKGYFHEAEGYVLDCFEYLYENPDGKIAFLDFMQLFHNLSQILVTKTESGSSIDPLFLRYFEWGNGQQFIRDYYEEKAILDYLNGSFIQNIDKYYNVKNEPRLLQLIKLVSWKTIRKSLLQELVSTSTNFLRDMWKTLFDSTYLVEKLQNEVLYVIVENAECLSEDQAHVRLFANSCFINRNLKNKAKVTSF